MSRNATQECATTATDRKISLSTHNTAGIKSEQNHNLHCSRQRRTFSCPRTLYVRLWVHNQRVHQGFFEGIWLQIRRHPKILKAPKTKKNWCAPNYCTTNVSDMRNFPLFFLLLLPRVPPVWILWIPPFQMLRKIHLFIIDPDLKKTLWRGGGHFWRFQRKLEPFCGGTRGLFIRRLFIKVGVMVPQVYFTEIEHWFITPAAEKCETRWLVTKVRRHPKFENIFPKHRIHFS